MDTTTRHDTHGDQPSSLETNVNNRAPERRGVILKGCGSSLPPAVVSNDDLSQTLDTSHEWIFSRTGIARRHIASPGTYTSDLGVEAAKAALDNAGITAEDIDLILVATTTPDHTFPPTAARIQAKLGITRGFAFDIAAVCSGFVFALATADQYLQSAIARTALVIGAETMSRLINWEDRSTAVLFGDGAGACILQASDEKPPLNESKSHTDAPDTRPGFLAHQLHTNGEGYEALKTSGGPSTTQETGTITMEGREVFKQAVLSLTQVTRATLAKAGLNLKSIDWIIPHQANRRIVEAVAERLHLPLEKIILTGEDHANTSAASIPLALDHAWRSGRIKPGQLVLFHAFAGGFCWGANLLRV